MDALEETKDDKNRLQPDFVSEWIKSALGAKQEWFDSLGLGQDVRIEGESLMGAALVIERQLVHLELFRKDKKLDAVDKYTPARSAFIRPDEDALI